MALTPLSCLHMPWLLALPRHWQHPQWLTDICLCLSQEVKITTLCQIYFEKKYMQTHRYLFCNQHVKDCWPVECSGNWYVKKCAQLDLLKSAWRNEIVGHISQHHGQLTKGYSVVPPQMGPRLFPWGSKSTLQGPLLLTRITAWVSNLVSSKVWDEITYPFPKFNGCTTEVWEWINNFTIHFIMDEITNPCRD